MPKTLTKREHKSYAANVAPHWRRHLRADELPTHEKIVRPYGATPRNGKDWR